MGQYKNSNTFTIYNYLILPSSMIMTYTIVEVIVKKKHSLSLLSSLEDQRNLKIYITKNTTFPMTNNHSLLSEIQVVMLLADHNSDYHCL